MPDAGEQNFVVHRVSRLPDMRYVEIMARRQRPSALRGDGTINYDELVIAIPIEDVPQVLDRLRIDWSVEK